MVLLASPLNAQSPLVLQLHNDDQGWSLAWPARLRDGHGVEQSPVFELQRSENLKDWSAVGSTFQGKTDTATEILTSRLSTEAPQGFYRLVARFPSERRVAKLGRGGAEVFGYATAFEDELKAIGQITPEQFAARFPAPTNYLGGLDWYPTTADFWN